MSTDLMIDIETLSTANNAHVLSIGLVWFDKRHTNEPLIELPIILPNQQNQTKSKIDVDTVWWWMGQPSTARDATFGDTRERISCAKAGETIRDAVESAQRVWAKDPDFDCTILANFINNYADTNYKWPFWKNRSVRTMLDMAPAANKLPFDGVRHDALADAVHQAKQMCLAFDLLNSTRA